MPLVSASGAYGAGKQIRDLYPGPSTLLFGAAINAIGSAPNTEMTEIVSRARVRLAEVGISNDPLIRDLVRVASERAAFDKVSAMLKHEFAQGMQLSGKYSEEQIAKLVPQIVEATHDTRHRAVIRRDVWAVGQIQGDIQRATTVGLPTEVTVNSLFLETPGGDQHYHYGSDLMGPIVHAAQIGCAFAIQKRIVDLR